MSLSGVLTRLGSPFAMAGPGVAVEIAPGRLSAVTLGTDHGRPVIAACAVEALPPEAVRPSVNALNLLDPSGVEEALKRAFDRLGRRPRRVALVIPDPAAKVSLLRFEHVPPRGQDLERLITWQVRKTAPFRIEDATITYTPGAVLPEGGREFIVALTRRDIVEQYEQVCAAAGAYAGLVDLSTFNLINLVLAAGGAETGAPADWLLVNITSDYSTVAVLRGGDLIVFRTRASDGEGSLADLVHQTAMYYEDRIGGTGFARVIIAGSAGAVTSAAAQELRATIQDRLGVTVEAIDPRQAAALRDRITAGPDVLDALAAPVGILLRDRVA